MRTKTLLIAAAALAVGVATSMAQTYSQNVVGYYNLNLVAGYNMVSVQFAVGNSNGASEIFPNIPDGTEMFTWDKNNAAYVYNFYDTQGGLTAPAVSWYMADYGTLTNQPVLVPGQSVFLFLTSPVTNTVVGAVVNTNIDNLVNGYNMVASALPLGGATTNNLFNMATLPDGTELFTWDPVAQKYNYNFYDTQSGSTTPANSWYMADYGTLTNAPIFSVGQGMFFFTTATFTWTQTYTNTP
jgi:hypothetical protein